MKITIAKLWKAWGWIPLVILTFIIIPKVQHHFKQQQRKSYGFNFNETRLEKGIRPIPTGFIPNSDFSNYRNPDFPIKMGFVGKELTFKENFLGKVKIETEFDTYYTVEGHLRINYDHGNDSTFIWLADKKISLDSAMQLIKEK